MKITHMSYQSTLTVNINGAYFKEEYREDIDIDPEDNIEEQRQALMDRVHTCVDSAIDEIRRSNE